MEEKVRKLLGRLDEVEELLGKPDILSDQKAYRASTQEHAQLSEIRDAWQKLQSLEKQLDENKKLAADEKDLEFLEVIREEIQRADKDLEATKRAILNLLVPPDPRDSRSIIMELRAGTGGDEG